MGTFINRVLPNDQFLALINANLPSATNPFVTMDEFLAQSFVNGVVFDYNALPDPATVPNTFYWANNAVTHTTLFITFTDFPRGMYYSNGVSWEFTNIPIQASLIEVNAGTDKTKYVTSYTFENASKWSTKANVRIANLQVSNYTVTDIDRNIECDGTFIITLPLLSSILHYEDIDITNNGSGLITINTSGGELLGDVTTFILYPLESLTIAKGNTTYLVK
jgi:hypothetical protein